MLIGELCRGSPILIFIHDPTGRNEFIWIISNWSKIYNISVCVMIQKHGIFCIFYDFMCFIIILYSLTSFFRVLRRFLRGFQLILVSEASSSIFLSKIPSESANFPTNLATGHQFPKVLSRYAQRFPSSARTSASLLSAPYAWGRLINSNYTSEINVFDDKNRFFVNLQCFLA